MTRHVVLVCGPPCSGKTTWVQHHAASGDLVVDHDAVAQRLGSTRHHNHDAQLRQQAEQHVAQLLHHVATMEHGTAWVIRTAPRAGHRARLARYLRADRVVVLAPPLPELLARAQARPAKAEARRAIRSWVSRYEPRDGEDVIT